MRDPFAGMPACVICGGERKVLTFGLRRVQKVRLRNGEPYWTSRGVGSIDLCEKCWERFAKPRMRTAMAQDQEALT